MLNNQYVYAAGGEVSFGSLEYSEPEDSKFPIGVYISTTDTNQTYHIELKYDKNRMSYIKGGDSEEDGIITLEGKGLSSRRKYMLSFETISGGEAYLSVQSGYTTDADGSNKQDIDKLLNVNIFIEGEDTALALEQAEAEREAAALEETSNEISPVTDVVATQDSVEERESENPEDMKLETNLLENVESTLLNDPVMIGLTVGLIVAVIALIVAVVLFIGRKKRRKKREAIRVARRNQHIAEALKVQDLDSVEEVEEAEVSTDPETVISVKNVTMKFKVATQSTSGIKDYIIQFLKRNISYREFYALDNVSFDVSKGEVVGIIGTNGSGKSTILKIVSGALRPTSGSVEVDRKKVQLLTLGTGFDMELTGRENVYLNGAIIGYSKKFLDDHYDEIVEFAELQDFMDEKVKNYSSGMVSRLGFAIATAGDAAEILILDEVLSVGDEFFRKKSLKRVKEMIHGGSTVLMVSHGMGTIRDNCSKVVWIEKGKLRMVGTPDVVCKAYQHMQEEGVPEPIKAVSEVS
ncbi:ABC transporter ATP-binding protein [Pseudobutyrivibrio ruminis]|uniref:ABC transporter ATP-binding protein n=1 Tax=Pseudobutyrivibrio ruminis TaxID=46206 RepID=UPI0004146091|nr:ABC transporter ATP-binding protein [Pseudobutyrivibrio ruminis]